MREENANASSKCFREDCTNVQSCLSIYFLYTKGRDIDEGLCQTSCSRLLINYTALISVWIEGQSILTGGQQYWSPVSCIKLRSNKYDTDTFACKVIYSKQLIKCHLIKWFCIGRGQMYWHRTSTVSLGTVCNINGIVICSIEILDTLPRTSMQHTSCMNFGTFDLEVLVLKHTLECTCSTNAP